MNTETTCEVCKSLSFCQQVNLLEQQLSICHQCYQRTKLVSKQLKKLIIDYLPGWPLEGDQVILLVNGIRGKFKGQTGIINSSYWMPGKRMEDCTFGIRVPGQIAPGETEEYVGPYFGSQFKLLKQEAND